MRARLTSLLVTTLLCPQLVVAEHSPRSPSSDVRSLVIRDQRLDRARGALVLELENRSQSPITAWTIAITAGSSLGSEFTSYLTTDIVPTSAVDESSSPFDQRHPPSTIAAGDAREVEFELASGTLDAAFTVVAARVTAIVFDDGRAEGSRDWVEGIFDARRERALVLDSAARELQALRESHGVGITKGEAIRQLRTVLGSRDGARDLSSAPPLVASAASLAVEEVAALLSEAAAGSDGPLQDHEIANLVDHLRALSIAAMANLPVRVP